METVQSVHNPSARKITHHVGDKCLGGHFDQASLKECAAWIDNRSEGGPRRDGEKLGLRALLRVMRQAGWEYGHCQYFDPAQKAWVTWWAFSCTDASLGGESISNDDRETQLAIYRTACVALFSYPAQADTQAATRRWRL